MLARTPRRPKGTLKKNTQRQSRAFTKNPPKAGPATAPVPTTVMIRPSALPLSWEGNMAVMMAMPVPWVIAAPTP